MLSEMLPTMRIAKITLFFAQGERLTVREVAERMEMTPRGARMMLEKISLAVPLTDEGGVWRICGSDGVLERGET